MAVVSADKFSKIYIRFWISDIFFFYRLGCALNVDEYLANQDENISATDSEVDHRFKDENVVIRSLYHCLFALTHC